MDFLLFDISNISKTLLMMRNSDSQRDRRILRSLESVILTFLFDKNITKRSRCVDSARKSSWKRLPVCRSILFQSVCGRLRRAWDLFFLSPLVVIDWFCGRDQLLFATTETSQHRLTWLFSAILPVFSWLSRHRESWERHPRSHCFPFCVTRSFKVNICPFIVFGHTKIGCPRFPFIKMHLESHNEWLFYHEMVLWKHLSKHLLQWPLCVKPSTFYYLPF